MLALIQLSESSYIWHDLHHHPMFFSVPWLIACDFNSVLTAAKTSNPRKLDQRRSAGFLEWIFDTGLLDLRFSGSQFTWTRGTSFATFQGARLDRALCNTAWKLCFPFARVKILPELNSDHSPLQAGWCTHPDFHQFIQANWSNSRSLGENTTLLADSLLHWYTEGVHLVKFFVIIKSWSSGLSSCI